MFIGALCPSGHYLHRGTVIIGISLGASFSVPGDRCLVLCSRGFSVAGESWQGTSVDLRKAALLRRSGGPGRT